MGQAGVGRTCGNCGTTNAVNDQFCSNCGYLLNGGSTLTVNNTLPASSPAGRRITGALAPGNLLGGRYRVVQLMGKGGFGAVYKATDERFQGQRVVAIKEMSDAQLSPADKAQALQNFRHEADLLVQLNHPNLPNVSDFFEEAGKAYLVMEFVEGKTLANIQEDVGGPLDERQVMGWAAQLCAVLEYLHTRPNPVIFRDMKPSNVMVTPQDQIKLIDFGIARIFKRTVSKDTALLGSQGYAPLEQYGRGQSDARSDIYALGATLYDLLTNMLPADAPSRQIHPTVFVTPRRINPRISAKTEAIVLKAMEQQPQKRYQSAGEMYRAIVATGIVPGNNTLFPTGSSLATLPAQTQYASPPPGQRAPAVSPGGARQLAGAAPAKGGQVGVVLPPPTQPGAPPLPGQKGVSRRTFLIGGIAAAVATGTGLYFYLRSQNPAPGSTITVNFTFSTEKSDWINAAIDAFNKSNAVVNNKAVRIVPDSRGSGDAKNRILNGAIQPVAWSPASSLELNQLNAAWAKKNNGREIVISSGDLLPQSLVFTPLVFAVWKERANVLLNQYGSIDWPSLHDAFLLKNGWSDIGGQSDWGLVKFGQTRPDQSNSGLLSITLLAYSFFKLQRDLTVDQIQNSAFLQYLSDIQGAVTQFGRSSGTYLANEVIQKGPAAYDVIATYESVLLTNEKGAIQRQGQALQLFYPSLNIVSDNPFAILQGSWVNPEEQLAAKAFRDFLLAEPQQRQALLLGFRPTNPALKITDKIPGSPFIGQSPDIRIQQQIEPLAQTPGGDVVDELLKQWTQRYSNASTALSFIQSKIMGTI